MVRLLIILVCMSITACGTSSIKLSSTEHGAGGTSKGEYSEGTDSQHNNREGLMTTAYELPHGTPEEVGMSTEGLKKVDEVVQQYVDEGRIQGAVVAVSRRNMVVYMKAHGVLDEKTQAPMPEDTIFIMASSTKPVLGVAAMMMIEEGLISPDDPVAKYIPEYKDIQVAVPLGSDDKNFSIKRKYKHKKKKKSKDDSRTKFKREAQKLPEYRLEPVNRPLTIHDLLTHTAGLRTGGLGTALSASPKPTDTLASWVPEIARGPLDFQPGTRWAYSGSDGLKVVARIVEIASGMSLTEFVQTRILGPLGMKDTHWLVPEDKLYRTPVIYRGKSKGKSGRTGAGDGRLVGEDSSAYFSGVGGLFSTARDYLHFEQMLVNKGTLFGHRLLKPETVAMMSTNQVGDLYSKARKGGAGLGFGYSVAITLDPEQANSERIAGAFGWGGAAGTASWTTPSEELAVVVMVQQPTDLPNRIAAAVREAIVD